MGRDAKISKMPATSGDGNVLPLPPGGLNLGLTLDCGQVFHWREMAPGHWRGLIGKTPCEIRVAGDRVLSTAPAAVVRHYFRFEDDLDEFAKSFPLNEFSQEAMRACQGLRLLRQPFWECLGTFLCSSVKQLGHIRKVTDALRQRFGERVREGLFSFPEAEALATAKTEELAACGLGFRAARLRETARLVAAGEVSEEALNQLPNEEARRELQKLPGVGPKIANCVLLFSLGRLEVVPVDVWLRRILQSLEGRRLTSTEMEKAAARLGPYAGYVQQCLFHHARVNRAMRGSA